MRLFIAINFNDETRARLITLRKELRSRSLRGNFTHDDNLHLTLAFIGEVNPKQFDKIRAIKDLKLGRIQAPCAAVNYGSYRVVERNGMRREALHRKSFWARVDKGWVDEAWYAILAEDYFNRSETNPIPLGVYRHYKGNEYEVIGFAKHSETLEDMVVYKALYGERGTWVRPLSMWDNPIEIDGRTVKRFEYINGNERLEGMDNA